MNKKYTAVDLFAGGGGVTQGLKKAGFNVIAAVENDLKVIDTYKANHPDTTLFTHDIQHISASSIKALLKPGQTLDLLAGCPPCQGFSSLTYKYKQEDKRNALIMEMGRLLKELLPKTVMLENVPGLSKKGNKFFQAFTNLLVELEYQFEFRILQVADYGVPQLRKRLVLLAGRGGVLSFPKQSHKEKGGDGLLPWRTVSEALKGIPPPVKLKDTINSGGPQAYQWHVARNLSPINLERLKYIKPGGNRFDIPNEIRPNCHKGNNKGFSNVYGRISWDSPSPTITGGCTTLSKGRFGHPQEQRALSVREAARLQTFDDDYIFDTNHMDVVCKIIGNALPVEFSHHLAKSCIEHLNAH